MSILVTVNIFFVMLISGWLLTGQTGFIPESWLNWIRAKGGWPDLNSTEPELDNFQMNRLGEALNCWVCAGFWPGLIASPLALLVSDSTVLGLGSSVLIATGLLILVTKLFGEV